MRATLEDAVDVMKRALSSPAAQEIMDELGAALAVPSPAVQKIMDDLAAALAVRHPFDEELRKIFDQIQAPSIELRAYKPVALFIPQPGCRTDYVKPKRSIGFLARFT